MSIFGHIAHWAAKNAPSDSLNVLTDASETIRGGTTRTTLAAATLISSRFSNAVTSGTAWPFPPSQSGHQAEATNALDYVGTGNDLEPVQRAISRLARPSAPPAYPSSRVWMTAQAAAEARGLPPKVVPCDPGVNALDISRWRPARRSGRPHRASAIVIMSGTTL